MNTFELNTAIYNQVAKAAAEAFEFLRIAPGKYTPAQIVAAMKKKAASWTDDPADHLQDVVNISLDSFSCSFPLCGSFDILAKMATAYEIPTKARATFERTDEQRPALLVLDVPAAAREVAKAVLKKDPARPALTFAYYDTERRALVGTNGQVLSVCAAPSAQLAPEAADRKGFLIAPALLRSARITADSVNATDGHKVVECLDLRFPNWYAVFPELRDTDSLTLSKDTAAALRKAVANATKYAEAESGPNGFIKYVAIFGEAYTNRLTVRARRRNGADGWQYTDTTVQLPADLSRSFSLTVNGETFATLPAFSTLYIPANRRPAVVTGSGVVALVFALTLPEGFATICNTDPAPAWSRVVDPLADLLTPAEVVATTQQPEAITPEPVEVVAPEPTAATTEPTEPAAAAEPTNEPAPQPESITEPAQIVIDLAPRVYNDTAAPVAVGDRVIYNKFEGQQFEGVVTGYDEKINTYFIDLENGQKVATERDGLRPADNNPEPQPEAITEPEAVPAELLALLAIASELPTTTGTTEPTPEPRAEVLAPAGTTAPEAITEPEAVPTTNTRALVATIARRAQYAAALLLAVLLLAITPDRTQPTSAHSSQPAPARTYKYHILDLDEQSTPEAITEHTAPELPEVVITPSRHSKRAPMASKRATAPAAEPTTATAAADPLSTEPEAITTEPAEVEPETLDAITPEAEPEAIAEPTATNDDETSTPAPADDTTNEEPAPTTGATGTTATPATLAPVLVAAGVPAVLIPYIIAAF